MISLDLTPDEARALLFALEHLHEPAPVQVRSMPVVLKTYAKLAEALKATGRPRLVETPAPNEPVQKHL